jgi:high affinity Mn2+ porin
MRFASAIVLMAAIFLFCSDPGSARADAPVTQPSTQSLEVSTTQPPVAPATAENFNVHAQATIITQWHDGFRSPYVGPKSLLPDESAKTSVTGTLFMGLRMPWQGGAIYFDPEIAGGEGFSGVQGIADFPNGEIPKVGSPAPQPYVARAYYQQIFGLGGPAQHFDSDQNQLAGDEDVRRITVWLGKFAATDFFDNNTYAHDPRTQFMNLGMIDNTAWDYSADARGYTVGGAVEYNDATWALRYGFFQEPKVANGGTLDGHFPQAVGNVWELEDRWNIRDQPGVVRFLAYLNLADMGSYRAALAAPGPAGPDVTLSRTYSTKYGFGFSAEQSINPNLAIFARAGWNDGQTESWAFTEVDDMGSIGISLKGTNWGRPDDVVGVAGAIAGLSDAHKDYLAAGGIGFIIGDGKLSYAPEEVFEAYYNCKVVDHIFVTPDFQMVNNPAYNSDRGPVAILSLRVHADW